MWGTIEKHGGITLVASEGWVSIIHDATSVQVSGPYDTEADVRNFARIVLPHLQAIGRALPPRKR